MKKKILLTCICVTLALTAVLGAACDASPTGGVALSTVNDIYGMGAVSTVKLLGSSVSAQAVQTLATAASISTDGQSQQDENVKAEAEKFNEYFTALDSFLGEDLITTVAETNTDEGYDFQTKLTIGGRDLNGNQVEYVMYFTEELVKQETNDREIESAYTLEGVLVVGDEDYFLKGKREVEEEGDEVENELKIRAYADPSDESTYVEMKHESSVEADGNETEYVYSVYMNGRLVEQTAVEFETERKGSKELTEYELEFREGGAKGKYEIKREVKDGVVRIKVKYDIDGNRGEFTIREIEDENGEKQYEYTFSDNSKKLFK